MAKPITLRAPSSLASTNPLLSSTSSPVVAPPISWIEGSWNVTHSSLPMWKKSRNVVIKYARIPGTLPALLDDEVSYQSLSSTKRKTVCGVDKPFNPTGAPSPTLENGNGEGEDAASLGYNWRGKGWLMIASSKWEFLGYGEEEGGNKWAVTYFAKTMFTPAGVDFYSEEGGLKEETVDGIKVALEALGGDVAALAKQLFVVKMDDSRT
ncbi:uncharacterized protein BDR25DRAFT_304455 [Lindgomyces ingoldianus]|uniref:Uncharacterized protein n=1 Tax=Lindgomyces ingoldianus TaxID=673940 RepID=A0ACB6QQQ2_9PLEO|nr:uncharacterized protein BDR25DRAFT_304455 [Lindgomyces ingoldianus]KAF2469318.1 hypothetical protein BDR25DRAFT_304455 [Lindgomyces ingoldianus]